MKKILFIISILTTSFSFSQNIDHSGWNSLLQQHVTEEGNVNYKGFKSDQNKLDNYLTLLSKNTPGSSASKEDVLSYWINAYNAFTVKLIVDNYPLKSIKEIKQPWDSKFITIKGEQYSLNQIEHEILRKMDEPRIHFAINCASVSCPKLLNKAFTSANLEELFEISTKRFINSEENIITAKKIEISKIFSWFKSDFKQDGKTLIDFLNKYSEVTINKKAKVKFKDYNWNLNE